MDSIFIINNYMISRTDKIQLICKLLNVETSSRAKKT